MKNPSAAVKQLRSSLSGSAQKSQVKSGTRSGREIIEVAAFRLDSLIPYLMDAETDAVPN